MCLDTGLVSIGPFKLTINGQEYETDKLELRVIAELPLNVIDGLWINTMVLNSKRHLIVEQRVPGKVIKRSTSENEVSINASWGEVLFAELDEELLENKGVSIITTYSKSGKEIVNLHDPNGSFSYKTSIYTYEFTSGHMIAFKITKECFRHFPGVTRIDEVWIKHK